MRYLLILLIFTSCLGSKKVTEKESTIKQIEKSEVKKDSSNVTTVNKAIDDKVTTKVSDSGDEEMNARIDEILRKLNTQKSSGSNNYNLYYDEQLRELRAEFSVGETKDSEIITDKAETSEKSYEEQVSENIKKTISIIPWWLWVIAAFVFRKQIIGFIAVFYPPIRGITTVKDLFTPPSKT